MSIIVRRLDDAAETWHAPTYKKPDGYCQNTEIPYMVSGAANRAEAIAAVIAEAPPEYNGVPLETVRFDDWQGDTATVTASYASDDGTSSTGDDDDDEATLSYDCGGGTKHMTHAYYQSRVYGGDTDDAGGMIGWNGKSGSEAEFSGVDVPCADMRLTYTKVMSRSKVTSVSYMKTVGHLTGMVNNDTFKGWAAGELMFLGCSFSASLKGRDKITVSFNFRAMPNEDNCVVAGKNVGSKKGFEYMWARSETEADSDGKPKVDVKGIYKSGVCLRTNFHKLGI